MPYENPACVIGSGKLLAQDFANFVFDAFNVKDVELQPNLVTIVGRRPFLAHPRQNGLSDEFGNTYRHILNEVRISTPILTFSF